MTIICVDDHPLLLSGIGQNVRDLAPQAEIFCFGDAKDALSCVDEHGCDVLFCEIEMYSGNGLQLAEQIKKRCPRVNIIFLTVCSEHEYAKEVLRLRPSGYLTKPASLKQIAEELNNLRYPVIDATVVDHPNRMVCSSVG